ncbi:PREDICTED: uncharacterized protein LOC106110741, partial [Papilio polytes]|uniref:uncharacterized protein LOC106110741 n=1 Tax=Papilio polytes TaxID=76194 RepID=UPI0006768047
MVTTKLDSGTCYKWEEMRNSLPEIPTLEHFLDFLKNRANVLETINSQNFNKPKFTKPQPSIQSKVQTKSFALTAKHSAPSSSRTQFECLLCKGTHRLFECTTFKSKSPEERTELVSKLNLCENCLRLGHKVQNCRLPGSCRSCKQKHNTLLHLTQSNECLNTNSNQSQNLSAITTNINSEILLCTAQVQLRNPNTNQILTARALLDSGSQSTFITERIQVQLDLTPQPTNVNVVGLSDTPLPIKTRRCALHLQSLSNDFNVKMTCLVIPKIADKLPKVSLDVSQFDLSNFQLADPRFFEPASIDMLIGADLFWDLIGSSQHSLGPNKPILRSSKLGWLIAGPLPTLIKNEPKQSNNVTRCNFLLNQADSASIHEALQRFWELENFPQSHSFTKEENLCEQHYISNTYRLNNGRFCVALPLREKKDCLGDSYSLAKKRFLSLETRFRKQPDLKSAYADFIREYDELGHLSEAPLLRPPNAHYLPHHPVIRTNSESTKLRVVFDASAATSTGVSVNDLQMVGPVIQDSLFDILVRFRQYKYILSGDIEKMYRQVLVRECDRDLQLILWRNNEGEPLRALRLNTVTYGFSSASFLATRCIWQLGEESTDPKIKQIIQHDFYCDDLLTGADDDETLKYIQRQVSGELAKGCFRLRKYRSNLPSLLSECSLPADGDLIISTATSTLGIGWHPDTDLLQFQIQYSPTNILTKRSILSSTFKIFDPLGLLALCTIKPKILLQTLWSMKLDWDEEVPSNIKRSWLKFTEQINSLSTIQIPRRVLINNPKFIEMHTFCDASQNAIGACVYLKSIDASGNVHVSLLSAKARVAPLKPTTIPKLELCSAVLGAQLSSAVTQALRCKIDRHIYWTDSKVALGWIQTTSRTKTFVANRVAVITELSEPQSWRHVPSAENPADLCSRGVDPQYVSDSNIWWQGPGFLKLDKSSWPNAEIQTLDLPELKALPNLVAEPAPSVAFLDVTRYSRLVKAQRVAARAIRFINNCKDPQNKNVDILSVDELYKALKFLIKFAQCESFSLEMQCLKNNKPLPNKSNLKQLNVFLDKEDIIRVGGRITSSRYSYDKRHPVLLKSNHPLTKLIFENEHIRLLHAPPQLLLTSIRDQYWPIGGRRLAQHVYKHCYKCRRFEGSSMANIMGGLPSDRVEMDYPFISAATDFAGPFLITDRKGRGCKISKCYMCIFICCRYRCIHLEAVSELTKEAFLLTLTRFIARRGKPNVIYCDNGRNYVAAAREIKEFVNYHKDYIGDLAAQRGIQFKFSPAYAPHFNGLAEAGVKSAKFHIKRMLGQTHLTFEELSSLFTQIEAILNSRPLCPLSPSPDDFQPLTPGHFLIFRPLTSLPSATTPSYSEGSPTLRNRFQRIEQVRQHFWNRWSREYISELQQRSKWRIQARNLQLDDLVLVKDEAPPLQWRLGRVSKLFPGPDGVPRVADVRTANGS